MTDSIIAGLERDIDAQQPELIEFCADLVAAESISPPGNTTRVAERVRRYLTEAGIAVETLCVDPSTPNLIASVAGRSSGPHVILNAHMDTMEPGDPGQWSVPILHLTRQAGRLYGLGLGNMKGALAAMCLTTVLLSRRPVWAGRLTMTAVSDEVLFGERGSAALLQQRPDLLGDALISGEGPGFMELAVGEKGLAWLDVETTAVGGHASRAQLGRTAISELAASLGRLDTLNEIYAPLPEALHGVYPGEDLVGCRVSANIGTISGGTLRGQIACHAKAEIDVRLPPGFGVEELVQRAESLIASYPNTRVALRKGWNANWTGLQEPLVQIVAAASHEVRGAQPRRVIRLPASDAMRWRARGVAAICFGPQPTLSSGADDHVLEQDLIDCAKIYARSALALLRTP